VLAFYWLVFGCQYLLVGNSDIDILVVGNLGVGILLVGNLDVNILLVGNLDVDKRAWHRVVSMRCLRLLYIGPRNSRMVKD
jgi:hypothetical protein